MKFIRSMLDKQSDYIRLRWTLWSNTYVRIEIAANTNKSSVKNVEPKVVCLERLPELHFPLTVQESSWYQFVDANKTDVIWRLRTVIIYVQYQPPNIISTPVPMEFKIPLPIEVLAILPIFAVLGGKEIKTHFR